MLPQMGLEPLVALLKGQRGSPRDSSALRKAGAKKTWLTATRQADTPLVHIRYHKKG